MHMFDKCQGIINGKLFFFSFFFVQFLTCTVHCQFDLLFILLWIHNNVNKCIFIEYIVIYCYHIYKYVYCLVIVSPFFFLMKPMSSFFSNIFKSQCICITIAIFRSRPSCHLSSVTNLWSFITKFVSFIKYIFLLWNDWIKKNK